ncbi:uncharacterized protein LOC133312878 [Gastrolobium bilobum]|uniref:uncharacterized protein LOC133284718 n=1 Tax=Gastrolobium bilobum TaxID=150636 RepID=UPI002AB2FC99|nr:uncharacterized protein LOC133284718 [Gastrolobium bilobum]XP_061370135.1 uncharacterized protein LOC133312878 [Gastrolobium bilobum]
MSSFNPLATILSQKPMDAQPAEDAPEATKAQFQQEKEKWEKANVAVPCYILASLANHLQEQVSIVESGAAMLQTLYDVFAMSSSSARQIALNAVTKTVMSGGSVQDHCLSMIANFKKVEDHGVRFEQEVKVDLLLQSLPDYFNHFKMNYNMNKLNLDLTQLMHELESAEQSLVK